MKIFCVRHGETDWNREGRFQGQIDIPLNARGRAQAEMARDALSCVRFDTVWSSPLSRALETARTIAGKADIATHPGLAEIAHGLWEGKLLAEVRAEWPDLLELWHTAPDAVTMPEGESLAGVRARAAAAFDDIARAARGTRAENVLLATHDATLKALLCHILEAPLSSFRRFQLANASITIVESDPAVEGWRIPLAGYVHNPENPFGRAEQAGL